MNDLRVSDMMPCLFLFRSYGSWFDRLDGLSANRAGNVALEPALNAVLMEAVPYVTR